MSITDEQIKPRSIQKTTWAALLLCLTHTAHIPIMQSFIKIISFSKCLRLYIKIQLIFIILTLHSVNLLKHLLVPAVVLQILGISYVNNHRVLLLPF